MPHRCRDCSNRPMFSVKKGTIMEASNVGHQKWAIAIYLITTNLKGVFGMKLHRDLKISQKSACNLALQSRKSFESDTQLFEGPVETNETDIGGKRKYMPNTKRKELEKLGKGTTGKIAVIGSKDRNTNKVVAQSVSGTEKDTLQGFVKEHANPKADVYTDDFRSYTGLPSLHKTVNHSAREYVRAWLTQRVLNRFGVCSSADTWDHYITSARSALIIMKPSLLADTMFDRKTRESKRYC